MSAIARDDIPARCEAVGAATEAATCLFLERDGIVQKVPGHDLGQLFDSILGRLLHINLHSDAGTVRETVAMIVRLRGLCRRWDNAGRRTDDATTYPRGT
jgi:flagellin-specific chaperone FliS